MRNYILLFFLFISINSFSQKEGQIFCEGDPSESFFPLLNGTKYIVWGSTYYSEEKVGEKEINGKIYSEYVQAWESGDNVNLYLREENNVILQFEECCTEDTVRLPEDLLVNTIWETIDKSATYSVISLKGQLKTPVCNYKNILILELIAKNGNFNFYYQKGYGYIGATQNGELISFVTPQKPTED